MTMNKITFDHLMCFMQGIQILLNQEQHLIPRSTLNVLPLICNIVNQGPLNNKRLERISVFLHFFDK